MEFHNWSLDHPKHWRTRQKYFALRNVLVCCYQMTDREIFIFVTKRIILGFKKTIRKRNAHFLLTFQSLLVTWCTNSLTFNNCRLCPHCIYLFCIYLRKNSDLCHLQHKLIGFINEIKSVYYAVRTGPLNKTVCASSLKG